MGIQIRRHHTTRLKKKRRKYWRRDMLNDKELLSKVVKTPCTCSCPMCGNPRKHFNEKTIQERRNAIKYFDA